MKMRLGFVFLLACGLVDGLRYRDEQHRTLADPAEEAKSEKAAAADGANKSAGNKSAEPAPPAMEGTAHEDNFQDELADQADPEFDKLSGGDDCISWEDFKKPLQEQFQMGAIDRKDMTEEDKKWEKQVIKDIMADMEMTYKYADRLDKEDGCVTKAEYKKAMELEGPPPGFQEEKIKACKAECSSEEDAKKCEEEVQHELEEEERFEFNAMDRNGDEQISKPEAYHYASENMPHADVSQESLDKFFDESDVDKNGFLSYDEFRGAGEQIEGDGNEMEDAPPMGDGPPSSHESTPSHESTAPHEALFFRIMNAKIVQKRVTVEHMLAAKPGFAGLARIMSWSDKASTRYSSHRRKCSK